MMDQKRLMTVAHAIFLVLDNKTLGAVAGKANEEASNLRTIEAVEAQIGPITSNEFELGCQALNDLLMQFIMSETKTATMH